jgi:hypothetical protein
VWEALNLARMVQHGLAYSSRRVNARSNVQAW